MFDTRDETDSAHIAEAPEVDAGDVIDEVAALLARRDRLDATIAQLIRRGIDTEAFRGDGYPSMSALLRHRASLHPGDAHRLVTRANGLADTPQVAAAFASGALTAAQVDVLLDARAVAPEPFTQAEGQLVATAVATPLVGELRKVLDYWLDQVAADDLAIERHLQATNSLRIRRHANTATATWHMTLESAERVRAITDPGPPAREDPRSPAERRSDKLLDIVIGAATGGPDLIVHVTAHTLTHPTSDTAGGGHRHHTGVVQISETGYGTFLTGDETRRLACDATITRVVFDTDSQPLDLGRSHRLVTASLRKAVIARDRHCVFPGCDRPPQWCDVHHIISWARGGATAIDNLVLLCRYHHTLVHEGGWTLTGAPGDLHFIRSNGTELNPNPPPRTRRRAAIWDAAERPALPPGGLVDLIKQVHGVGSSRASPTT